MAWTLPMLAALAASAPAMPAAAARDLRLPLLALNGAVDGVHVTNLCYGRPADKGIGPLLARIEAARARAAALIGGADPAAGDSDWTCRRTIGRRLRDRDMRAMVLPRLEALETALAH